jgi:hypothetical protein
MEFNIEFRSKEGNFLFGLYGDFARKAFSNLNNTPEFIKKLSSIDGKGEFVILECIYPAGYKIGGVVEIIMKPGDYIKVINN